MSEENSYISPFADSAKENDSDTEQNSATEEDNATYQPHIFAVKGRIGRLRYLAYGIGFSLSVYAILIYMIGHSLFSKSGSLESLIVSIVVIGGLITLSMLVLSIIFMIRRLNDLDQTGWLWLLMIIPIVNILLVLYLIFAPGSSGVNKYGPAPCENSLIVKILAFLFPVLFLVGIVVQTLEVIFPVIFV